MSGSYLQDRGPTFNQDVGEFLETMGVEGVWDTGGGGPRFGEFLGRLGERLGDSFNFYGDE